MGKLVVGLGVCLLGVGAWIGIAAWQWHHADLEQAFRARVAGELPAGSAATLTPGSLLTGDLSDTARLVCGTVSVTGANGRSSDHLYSMVVVKTLFGTAINDGFTPATPAANQVLSDQNCASLRAHRATGAAASSP